MALILLCFGAPFSCAEPQEATATAIEAAEDDSWSPFGAVGRIAPLRSLSRSSRDDADSFADWVWSLPVLYRNRDAHLLQEIRLIGRYHGQYGSISGSGGDWDGWENRRKRLGFVVDFLQDFRFRVQAKGGGESGVFDGENIEDAWIAWRPSSDLGLVAQVGQFKPLWSYEYSLSSNKMSTFERSQFINQFHPSRATGAMIGIRRDPWIFALSGFSGDIETGYGSGTGSFGLVNVGWDLSDRLAGWDSLKWRLDYLYNDGSDQIGLYRHAVATNVAGARGRWEVAVDLMYIDGDRGQGNAFGLTILPVYELIEDKLQFAARYHLSTASNDSLLLQERYEQELSGLELRAPGDRYQSVYAGLNWLVYGHNLKFMTGVEYSTRDSSEEAGEFDAWTVFSGIRISF